ncbi:glycosyltransferase family protein [Leuconostoc carnosum]|uniref:YfhO family protein n=1 Tax=Leuconostoc carnosum TaxID=1252 RepID=UPI00123B783E|nr:YfhO family protein [Leuconostoc carnosum]KAA8368067.1 YfhO family protein [Leuconostoc carnosum]KAA8381259.1 YfhO family protein [Leuconostoc carnosum]
MKFIKKMDIWLIFSLFSIIILLPQINQHALVLGGDSLFHMNRFYDAMMQIKEGNIQYFVSMYGYSQSGRIVNALYGPYLAYINGFIMLLTHSWLKYQIVSDWIVNVIAASTMYYLLRSNYVQKSYAVWISILYVTTYAVTAWTLSQQFLSWGAALFPLGISAATRMIRDKNEPVKIIELALSVTLIIQSHVLTSLILVLVLTVFFIWSMFTTYNIKKLIFGVLISSILTTMLTSNVWGALLEVYGSNHLLAPFHNMEPLQNGTINLSLTNSQLSIGLATLIIIQIMYVFLNKNNLSKLNVGVTIIGLIFFILSTNFLPWNTIFLHFKSIAIIQFPIRLFIPAITLLLLGLGLSLTDFSSRVQNHLNIDYLLIGLALFTVLNITAVVTDISGQASFWKTEQVITRKANVRELVKGDRLRQLFDSKQDRGKALEYVYKPTSDYVPILDKEANIENPYGVFDKEIYKQNKSVTKSVVDRKLVVKWNDENGGDIRQIPIIKYQNTQLILNGQTLAKNQYSLSEIGTVSIKSKRGLNQMILSYQPSFIFHLLMVLNVLAWISVLIFLLIPKTVKLNIRKHYKRSKFLN